MWIEKVSEKNIGYCKLMVPGISSSVVTLYVHGSEYTYSGAVGNTSYLNCKVEASSLKEAETVLEQKMKQAYKAALEDAQKKVELYERIIDAI